MSRIAKLRIYLYTELWSRGLPENSTVRLLIGWPLVLLPLLVFSQIVTPHPVWVVLLVVLVALYLGGYLWVRSQVQTVAFDRRRQGPVLVAGDILREEFTLANKGRLPILWAEFVDFSDLPNYMPGSVVAAPVERLLFLVEGSRVRPARGLPAGTASPAYRRSIWPLCCRNTL